MGGRYRSVIIKQRKSTKRLQFLTSSIEIFELFKEKSWFWLIRWDSQFQFSTWISHPPPLISPLCWFQTNNKETNNSKVLYSKNFLTWLIPLDFSQRLPIRKEHIASPQILVVLNVVNVRDLCFFLIKLKKGQRKISQKTKQTVKVTSILKSSAFFPLSNQHVTV